MNCEFAHIAKVLHAIPPVTGGDTIVKQVRLDSRLIESGDLFIPLDGRNTDGHSYIPDVLARGGCTLARKDYPVTEDAALIRVDDPRQALLDLAAHIVSESSTRFIGVTGSNGKTTFKDLLYHITRDYSVMGKTPGNLNSLEGVPLTVLNCLNDQDWFIAEMGASSPGEISRLSRLLKPEMALITCTGLAHVGFFGDLNGVADAKSEIWQGLPESGVAFYPADDKRLEERAPQQKCVTFTVDPAIPADWLGRPMETGDDGCLVLELDGMAVKSPIPGVHGAKLLTAAWAVSREMGMTATAINSGLAGFEPPDGRLKVRSNSRFTIIDDSYNSSPDSLKTALDFLAGFPCSGRRIAVLAGMLELGAQSAVLHGEAGKYADGLPIHEFMILGAEALPLFDALQRDKRYYTVSGDLLAELTTVIKPGDVVLFKGSNSFGLREMVRNLENG